MPLFIKTESFTADMIKLLPRRRQQYLQKHRSWIDKLKQSGVKISSGYLVDENRLPGGGGLLVIEASSYSEAKLLIEQDPMILSGFVTWTLQEWIPVSGKLIV